MWACAWYCFCYIVYLQRMKLANKKMMSLHNCIVGLNCLHLHFKNSFIKSMWKKLCIQIVIQIAGLKLGAKKRFYMNWKYTKKLKNYYSFLRRKIVVNIIDGNKRGENKRMSYCQCFRPSGVRLFRKGSLGIRSLPHRRNSDPETSHLKEPVPCLHPPRLISHI